MASPSAQDMEDLSVFLIEQGLEAYEDEIRKRGVNKPSQILRLTEADVEIIIPNKPIHARKLASLVRGRRLSSSKFTVELSDDNESRSSGEGPQRRASRTPTPSLKEGLSPVIKRLINARGEAAKKNSRKSAQVVKLETMKTTVATFEEITAEGGVLPASQLVMLIDRHVRAPIDKRLSTLCAVKVVQADAKATQPSFWSKIDTTKAQLSPLLAAIMQAKLASQALESSAPQAQEKQKLITENIEYMKSNIPKQKRRSIFKKTGDVLKKSATKNEQKEKEAEAFKAVVSEAAMEMQSRFHATMNEWDELTRLQYECERNGKTIDDAIEAMKGFSKMNLVEGEMDGELQMMVEGEFEKVIEWLSSKADEARSTNDTVKAIFNSVQGTSVNSFNQLSENTVFCEMINDDAALEGAMSYRIVVPHGAVPGSNVLRVPIVKGNETTFVDVPVPQTATPGETVMVVHPNQPQTGEAAEEGTPEEEGAAGQPEIMRK